MSYDPQTSIKDGVSRFIDWYQDNRDWYEPLVRGADGNHAGQ
ncbi:MAG: hypothetical protein U5K70_08010 [Halodesulfurarchaeum sp.]|nr:hypothetical protein [Halodesulfurarchaeum sp.]